MSNRMGPALEERIMIDPAVCNGKPTLRGKRITVQTVLEFLSAGESRAEILRQYPSLEPEDIDACLAEPPLPTRTALRGSDRGDRVGGRAPTAAGAAAWPKST